MAVVMVVLKAELMVVFMAVLMVVLISVLIVLLMAVGSAISEFSIISALWVVYIDTVIIIIIRKGRQCKAGRERLTPYQSEDPNPTTPTHRMKEEKGKTVGDIK